MTRLIYTDVRPCPGCGRAIYRHPTAKTIMVHKLPDRDARPMCAHGYPSVPLTNGSLCAASGCTDEEYIRGI